MISFWDGPISGAKMLVSRRVSVITISCVVSGTFYTFSQPTWITWPSYIVYQGHLNFHLPISPLNCWLGLFQFGYILAVGLTHFFPNISGENSSASKVVILNKIDMIPADARVEKLSRSWFQPAGELGL